jgi:hypothetical protein
MTPEKKLTLLNILRPEHGGLQLQNTKVHSTVWQVLREETL